MKYRLLLADLDGTLLDFHKGEPIALAATFARFGIPNTQEMRQWYLTANAAQWKKLERGETTTAKLHVDRFRDFLALAKLDLDAGALSDEYIRQLGKQRQTLPGAVTLCREISLYMPIFIVTNGIAAIQRSRLQEGPMAGYLSGLMISEELGVAKPDPKMIWEALRQADVKPEEAVLLGDSLTADIACANAAGVDSILYTGGKPIPPNHGATYAVDSLDKATSIILQP